MATSAEEIHLFSISSEIPETRTLTKDEFSDAQEHDVPTEVGVVKVAVQGNPKKPPIISYHDIGLNHVTCFQGFFHSSDMRVLLEHFCVYHINAPGQHDGAVPLVQGYSYPTMDQLADTVFSVVNFFHLKYIIGLGVGAGSNILARFGLKYPKLVEGLVLINPSANQCGWVEWGYQKLNTWYLKSGSLTHFTEDYLLWHWFGRLTKDNNTDLVHMYREHVRTINPVNLALFIESYCARSDLRIVRPPDGLQNNDVNTLRCQTMLVTGDHGPFVEEAVDMNSRLDPVKTTLVKLSDCGGMVVEESPERLVESVRLFLQGLGYIPFLSQAKMVEARRKHRAIPTDALPALYSGQSDDQFSPVYQPTVC